MYNYYGDILTIQFYLSINKEPKPEPVPPPKEWKIRNPWRPLQASDKRLILHNGKSDISEKLQLRMGDTASIADRNYWLDSLRTCPASHQLFLSRLCSVLEHSYWQHPLSTAMQFVICILLVLHWRWDVLGLVKCIGKFEIMTGKVKSDKLL